MRCSRLLAAAVVLSSAPVRAEPPAATSTQAPLEGDALELSALPRSVAASVAPLPSAPKLRPAERAPGFHVERARHVPPGGISYATIGESAELVEKHMTGRQNEAPAASACFENGYPAPHLPAGFQWAGGLSAITNATADPASPPSSMIRSRKLLVAGPSRARLETRTAWVDPRGLGSRAVEASSIDLVRVRTLPGGVALWAGRVAEAGSSRESVVFVVDRGEPKPEDMFVGSAFAWHPTRSLNTSGSCPLVVDLVAAKGEGDQITVRFEVVLDAQPAGDDRGGIFGRPGKELRIRSVVLGLSSSWLASEPQPVLGLAHGFVGRERLQVL